MTKRRPKNENVTMKPKFNSILKKSPLIILESIFGFSRDVLLIYKDFQPANHYLNYK